MFDAVARRYDLSNDVMSLFQVHMWRRVTRAAVAAGPGMRVLDLAAGTGTSSVEYAADGAEVVACDFSTGMVAEGKRRHPEIAFVAGDATSLPFADETFVIAEFSPPVSRVFRRMYRFYLGSALPAAARLVSSNTQAYDYLGESILAWPDQRELAGLMHEAGWRGVGYKNLSGGIVAVHRATRGAQTAQAES